MPYFLQRPAFVIVPGKQTKINVLSRPDSGRMYEAGLREGWFSNDDFNLQTSAEGGLVSVSASSDDQTAEVMAGLVDLAASGAGAVAKAGLLAEGVDAPGTRLNKLSSTLETESDARLKIEKQVKSLRPDKPAGVRAGAWEELERLAAEVPDSKRSEFEKELREGIATEKPGVRLILRSRRLIPDQKVLQRVATLAEELERAASAKERANGWAKLAELVPEVPADRRAEYRALVCQGAGSEIAGGLLCMPGAIHAGIRIGDAELGSLAQGLGAAELGLPAPEAEASALETCRAVRARIASHAKASVADVQTMRPLEFDSLKVQGLEEDLYAWRAVNAFMSSLEANSSEASVAKFLKMKVEEAQNELAEDLSDAKDSNLKLKALREALKQAAKHREWFSAGDSSVELGRYERLLDAVAKGPSDGNSRAFADLSKELDRLSGELRGSLLPAAEKPATPASDTQYDDVLELTVKHSDMETTDAGLRDIADALMAFGEHDGVVFHAAVGWPDAKPLEARPWYSRTLESLGNLFDLNGGTRIHRVTLECEGGQCSGQARLAEVVKGIRVQAPEVCDLVAFHRDEKGKLKRTRAQAALPSQTLCYDVGFRGGIFTNRTLSVSLNSNGTPKEVKWLKKEKIDAALKSAAASVDKAATVAADIQKQQAAAARPPAPPSALEQLRQAMIKANMAAVAAGQELPYPEVFK